MVEPKRSEEEINEELEIEKIPFPYDTPCTIIKLLPDKKCIVINSTINNKEIFKISINIFNRNKKTTSTIFETSSKKIILDVAAIKKEVIKFLSALDYFDSKEQVEIRVNKAYVNMRPRLEYLERQNKKEKQEEENYVFTSKYIDDNIFAEQIYIEGHNKFCVYNFKTGQIETKTEIQTEYETIAPIYAEEVEKGAILLPSCTEEYHTDEKLDEDIKVFINKWLDIQEDILQFSVWNIKRSWVFEKFHTLNYLRARGDTGQGKTRFLDTLGYIHYKPIATTGATTSAPVFRIIEKWKGTLIMDEADFSKSDEAQDIIKIINQGYEKGKFVMRCDSNDNNKIDFFDPYCPKILATRKPFTDKAVESRCITQIMAGTRRKDINFNLNEDFWTEALSIRNKLLLWRFRNYNKISDETKKDFDFGELEPRLQQIVNSFVSLFKNDEKQLEKFKEFMKNKQEELIEERQNSFAGQIVGAIHSLLTNGNTNISSGDIITEGEMTDFKNNPLKPRAITSTLKSLGFGKSEQKKLDGINKRCLPLDSKHLTDLFTRYGNEVTVVTVVTETSIINNYVKEEEIEN